MSEARVSDLIFFMLYMERTRNEIENNVRDSAKNGKTPD